MVANSSSARGNGFSAEVTGVDARRQLRLSLGVVVVLAAGIVSTALSLGQHPIVAKRDVVSGLPVVAVHAEVDPAGAKAI